MSNQEPKDKTAIILKKAPKDRARGNMLRIMTSTYVHVAVYVLLPIWLNWLHSNLQNAKMNEYETDSIQFTIFTSQKQLDHIFFTIWCWLYTLWFSLI